jgi:hypothetical protein
MSIETSLSAKELTRRIFIFQKGAIRYTAGLKHLESCRDSFRNLKTLTIYTLHIQETFLHVKGRCNCTVHEQIINYNPINNKDYHKYVHKLELFNSKPSVAGCIFYEKLPHNAKQIQNKIQFTRELNKLLIIVVQLRTCSMTIMFQRDKYFFQILSFLSSIHAYVHTAKPVSHVLLKM